MTFFASCRQLLHLLFSRVASGDVSKKRLINDFVVRNNLPWKSTPLGNRIGGQRHSSTSERMGNKMHQNATQWPHCTVASSFLKMNSKIFGETCVPVRMSGWPSGLRRQTQEIASSFYWAFCSTIVGVGLNPTSDKILFTQQTMKWENQTISFPNKLEGIFFYHRPLTSIEFLLSIIFSVRRHSNASLASTSSWPSPFFVPQAKQRRRSLLEQKHVLFLISGRGAKNLDMPLFFQDITFPTSQAWEIIKQFTYI